MKDKSNMYKAGLRKKIYLIVFLMLAVGGAVVCAAVAAERSGMYWIGLGGEVSAENPEDNKGFFTVDVSDFLNTAGTGGGEAADEGSELVPLAIGPLPSIPTLTDEELKLYGILSKNDGRISEEDKTALDKDIHWTEVVLEPGETLKSISEEFNISEEDLRQANGLRKGEKPNPSEVLYVPDSHDDVVATLLFVRNLQKEELAFAKKGKLLEVHEYVVKEGDTLWGISGKFDLDVDTLVGCNQQVLGGSIHRLKLGMKLRVPNQDGVFVKVAKNDTLGKLADKYGSASDAVKLANAMKSDKLILGEEIFLPGGRGPHSVKGTRRRPPRFGQDHGRLAQLPLADYGAHIEQLRMEKEPVRKTARVPLRPRHRGSARNGYKSAGQRHGRAFRLDGRLRAHDSPLALQGAHDALRTLQQASCKKGRENFTRPDYSPRRKHGKVDGEPSAL